MRLDVDPGSGEGFLTGDAINVAARLQAAAPPMAVSVGEATHAATEKIFAFEACQPVALKGKSEPRGLARHRPFGPHRLRAAQLCLQLRGPRGRSSPPCRGLLDTATGGSNPRFGLICGEPGIGKSRLLAEFARRLDDRPELVTWRQGTCLPLGSNVTFWALSEIVRSASGILESDGVARAEARLEIMLPKGPQRDHLSV